MIIVRLMGGLGNQMFQYSVGRQLSCILNSQLELDLSYYRDDSLRGYSLNIFEIEENLVEIEKYSIIWENKAGLFDRINNKIKNLGSRSVKHVKEKHFHFDREILKLPDYIYLDGYWQSEKYFESIAPIIRRDFSFKMAKTQKYIEFSEKINASESVCVHIRRGDYITNSKTFEFHGVLSNTYYRNCVEKIANLVSEPIFFVFSDDPEWAFRNFKTKYPTVYVSSNIDNSLEDFRLMRKCKYHIIANSSFSWWSAWLCDYEQKIVLAPKRWFKTENLDTRDLIPNAWIQVDG